MAIKNLKNLFGKSVTPTATKIVPVTNVAAKKAVVKKAAKKTAAPKTAALKKVVAKKVPTKKTVAVKKATTKKVTASKAVKKSAPKRLVVASDSESFWVSDGQVLNSLIALEAAFKTMKPAAFTYHRTHDSNHFAEWVEAVLMDAECAEALRSAKNATAAHIIVSKHLKTYTK